MWSNPLAGGAALGSGASLRPPAQETVRSSYRSEHRRGAFVEPSCPRTTNRLLASTLAPRRRRLRIRRSGHGVTDRAQQHPLERTRPRVPTTTRPASTEASTKVSSAGQSSTRVVTVNSGWVWRSRSAAVPTIRSAEARSARSSTSSTLVPAGTGDDLQGRRCRRRAVRSEADGGCCFGGAVWYRQRRDAPARAVDP